MNVRKVATELYEYERLDGSCAWQKVRFDLVDEKGEVVGKTFRPRWQTREQRASGSPHWWTWGDPPWIGRYPYELPALFEALIEGWDIWICEGEKDAHSVMEAPDWGYVATTHPTGSAGGAARAGWTPDQIAWFAAGYRLGERSGRRSLVTVVADNDPTGLWLAAATRTRLIRWAGWDPGRVRVVLPAVEEHGADISDHIQEDLSESSLVTVGVDALREAAGAVADRVRPEGFRVAFGSGGGAGPDWRLRRSIAVRAEGLHSEIRPPDPGKVGLVDPAVSAAGRGRTSRHGMRRDTAHG